MDHPLFDFHLLDEIIAFADAPGAHVDHPIDLTDDSPMPEPGMYPIRVNHHVTHEGSTSYLVLWSNGDRSWEPAPKRSRVVRQLNYTWNMYGGSRRLRWCIARYHRLLNTLFLEVVQ